MGNLSLVYNEIMKEYDSIRAKNQSILTSRYNEIILALPEYKEIDDKIAELSIDAAKERLADPLFDISKYKSIKDELSSKKKQLLVSHNYPADYLDEIYDCPLCKDTGYIERQKCKCLSSKLISARYKQSHLDEILNKENFSTFSYKYYSDEEKVRAQKVEKAARAFVDNFDTNFENLLFFGSVGTGKTFISNCIAKELLDKGKSVIYFTAPSLFETIYSSFNKNSELDSDSFFDDIFNCDLLILDDLGTESYNSFTVGQFFIILNERLSRRKSTVISTNLDLQKINDLYSERSISRILGEYTVFLFQGQDLRLTIKKTKS